MALVAALGCPLESRCAIATSSTSMSGTPLPMHAAPAARRMRKQRTVARGRSVNAVAAPPVPFQNGAKHLEEWAPDSWSRFEAKQQPTYPDKVRQALYPRAPSNISRLKSASHM